MNLFCIKGNHFIFIRFLIRFCCKNLQHVVSWFEACTRLPLRRQSIPNLKNGFYRSHIESISYFLNEQYSFCKNILSAGAFGNGKDNSANAKEAIFEEMLCPTVFSLSLTSIFVLIWRNTPNCRNDCIISKDAKLNCPSILTHF